LKTIFSANFSAQHNLAKNIHKNNSMLAFSEN
jgi:hypothetical protein